MALYVVFLVIAAPFIGYKAIHFRQLSVFDEWQYAERVHQVAEGDYVMREGEMIGEWAQRTRMCRGIARVVEGHPVICRHRVEEVPLANSAAGDPPTYFWVTGTLTRIALATPFADNTVTTGRLVGIGWAAAGMLALFLLARDLGARRPAAFVVALTQPLVPGFAQQYAFMTPHATDVAVGALVAIASLRYLRGRWPWWPLALSGLLVALSKGTNITIVIAMGICMVAVIVWPGTFDRKTRIRALIGGVALGGATAAGTLGWMLAVSGLRAAEAAPPGDYLVESLDKQALTADAARMMSTFGEGGLLLLGAVTIMVMVGTAIAVWAGLTPAGPLLRPLAAGHVLGSMLSPVVLAVMVFVTSDQYIPVQLRYALALWALGLGFASLLLRTKTAIALALLLLTAWWALPVIWNLDGVVS